MRSNTHSNDPPGDRRLVRDAFSTIWKLLEHFNEKKFFDSEKYFLTDFGLFFKVKVTES